MLHTKDRKFEGPTLVIFLSKLAACLRSSTITLSITYSTDRKITIWRQYGFCKSKHSLGEHCTLSKWGSRSRSTSKSSQHQDEVLNLDEDHAFGDVELDQEDPEHGMRAVPLEVRVYL